MKRYFKIILAAILVVNFTSCDTFLDVNTDPNNPLHASYDLVLAPAVSSTATVVGGQYTILGCLWAQHFTQNNTANQYKTIDGYRLTSSDFNTSFNELYSGALNDYQTVRSEASAAGDWNTYLMATVMQSYTYQILVDLYGQIPYTDALKGKTDVNISPKYDSCQVVYDGLISEIDNALSKDFTLKSNKALGAKDFVFNGDMAKWKQFANSLKLKIYLRQVNVRPAVAQAGITALYTSGADFLTTDAMINPFKAEVKKQNPFYGSEVEYLGNNNLRASKTLFDYLNSKADPRLDSIYAVGSAGHKALAQGDYLALSTTYPNGILSSGKFRPTDPVYFMTLPEINFLQAEALVRYPSLVGNAKDKYDAGVEASFKYFVLTNASTFTNAGGFYEFNAAGTTDEKLKQIITQKWIASAICEPLEGFFDYNRTNYPTFFTVSKNTAIGNKFPQRLLFPADERSRNPNTPAQVGIDEKVWWAK